MGNAYGFFEIPSVTAAVVAVDIMCKTAAEANGIKKPVCAVVIPSPHEEVLKIVNGSANRIE